MGVLGYHSKQTGGPEGVLVSQQVNHPPVKLSQPHLHDPIMIFLSFKLNLTGMLDKSLRTDAHWERKEGLRRPSSPVSNITTIKNP